MKCSAGRLYYTDGPNCSTNNRIGPNYHIAKKHSAPKLAVTFMCKLCYQEFPGFCALRQYKKTQHGFFYQDSIC